jgi:copper homeostasis protein
LEVITDAGCRRILTSGKQLKAIDGAGLIKELVLEADGDIIIMPGSGIRPDNVKEIAERTGAREFHGALRNCKSSDMSYHNPSFNTMDEYMNAWIDPFEVGAMHLALEGIRSEQLSR